MSELAEHAKNEPDLRFPEFDGAWEGKTLGDFFTFKNGINADKSMYGYGQKFINVLDIINEHPILHNSIIGSVSVSETEFQKNEVIYGDILFQRSSETREEVGQSNVYLDREQSATFGGFVIRGRPIAKFNSSYFNLLLKTQAARKDMTAKSGGSTRYNVGQEALSEVKVTVASSTAEQEKIASFLSAVDEKIAQLEEKKKLLKDYKKGCMQQLFSQALRFKDENGNDYPDWEEKRLAKLLELVNGLTYAPSDIREEGLLVLRSSNVKNGEINLVDKVYVCLEIDETKQTQVNDILLCVRNGSQRLIGKSAIVKYPIEKATHGAFMSVLRGSLNNYIYQLMQTSLFFREVHKNLGATINSINGSDLKKFKFNIASHPDEQQKIADFLSALDDKISHSTEQLEQIKSFKKGLLQKMFV